MRTHAQSLALFLTSLLVLSGCSVVKGIFKVGFGAGIALVVVLVVVTGGIIAMVRK